MELHYDALTADPRRQARTDARRWGWELIIPVHKDVIGTEISNQYGNLSQNAACLQDLPHNLRTHGSQMTLSESCHNYKTPGSIMK